MVQGKREALLVVLHVLSWLEFVSSFASPTNYLDSLNSGTSKSVSIPPENDRERLSPEEFYGFTNPMANNWPGSKHEEYGGYLKRMGDRRSKSVIHKRNENDTPYSLKHAHDAGDDVWHHGTSKPMASSKGFKNPKLGGYLDNL